MSVLKIGIAGLGTVGCGLIGFVTGSGPLSRAVEIVGVSARSRERQREADITPYAWFDDPIALATHPDVDVFVELMGGSEGSAKDAVEAALSAGKTCRYRQQGFASRTWRGFSRIGRCQ
jgi:homoserine dehydrogenase